MPFTLAHPAAVLPLRRTRLVFSALVVGSLAPDFPYFFLLTERPGIGHSIEGVFRFCLPAGLAVLLVYHVIVKRPLVALAPAYVRDRLSPAELQFPFGPLSRFLRILGSLFLGTITHILWDGFTHDHGFFVKLWPLLREHVSWGNHHPPIYKLLQFGCSGIGLLILAWAIGRYWRTKMPAAQPVSSDLPSGWRVLILVVMACVAATVGLTVVYHYYQFSRHHWKWSTIQAVIYTIAAVNAEVFLYALAWHVRERVVNRKLLDHAEQELEVSSRR